MLGGERWVKGLDDKRFAVLRETLGLHERHRAKSANVAVVNGPPVTEDELERRVASLVVGEIAGVDEQGSGEPRLHDDTILAREIEHDQLRSTPCPHDRLSSHALREI